MGHSEGGIEVLQYGVRHPDRVAGLILLSTQAVSDATTDADVMARALRRKGEPWFAEAMAALQGMAASASDEEMAASGAKIFPLYWSDPGKMAPYREDIGATTMSAEAVKGALESKRLFFDLRPQLRELDIPALIVVGDDDIE